MRPENLIGAVRLLPKPSSPTPTPTSSPPNSRSASQASSRKSSLTRGSSVGEDSRLILCQVKEEPMQMETEHKIPREVLTCEKSEVQNKEEGDLTMFGSLGEKHLGTPWNIQGYPGKPGFCPLKEEGAFCGGSEEAVVTTRRGAGALEPFCPCLTCLRNSSCHPLSLHLLHLQLILPPAPAMSN